MPPCWVFYCNTLPQVIEQSFFLFLAQLTPAATATASLPGTAAGGGQGSTATTPREPASFLTKDIPPKAEMMFN